MIHAVFASLVFALFMPMAAILIRICTFRGVLWVHSGFMVTSWLMSIISLGTGIWMAQFTGDLHDPHAIIGFVIIGGCAIQPITGWIHHKLYKCHGRPNAATYTHVWLGRVLVTVGAINGGLGFNLSWNTPKSAIIGYSIGAAIVWITWMSTIFQSSVRSRGKKEGETSEKVYGQEPKDEQMKQVPSPAPPPSEMEKDMGIA